jgi:hypothetical protein
MAEPIPKELKNEIITKINIEGRSGADAVLRSACQT